MKKNILIIAAAACLPNLFSCSNSNDKDSNPIIEFRSYEYEVVAQLANTDTVGVEGENLCRISGHGILPVKIGNYEIESLVDSLSNLAEMIVINDKICRPALDNDFVLTQMNPSSTETGNIKGNELSVVLVTPQLIVWKDFSYLSPYKAAHGTYSTTYLNYSLEKGKVLKPEDLFIAGYKDRLLELIREKLIEDKVDLLVDISHVQIPDDFRITTHTIDFIYGVYEIAPYSSGEIEVSLPIWEINDLLAPGVEEMLFGKSFD